jgi:hypothetical protein
MIADALLTASVFVFVFAIADIMLSDEQKRRADLFTTRMWSKLDDFKSRSLIILLRSVGFSFVILGVGILSPLVITLILPNDPTVTSEIKFRDIVLGLSAGVLPSIAALVMLRWVISGTGYSVGVRATLASLALFVALPFCMPPIIDRLIDLTAPPPSPDVHYYPTDFGMKGILVLILTILSSASIISVIALPLIAIYVLQALILLSEFVFRRIAEYPKGSILAGSALATAALGIFKALS